MNWSLRIGRLAGIAVYIHWTFFLLLAWVAFAYAGQGGGVAAVLAGVGFLLAIFGCVVLHELGHALAARRYGIQTRDITLYPIGGVARLQRIPEDPKQELWVALAGPAVNAAIALVLLPFALQMPVTPEMLAGGMTAAVFVWQLLVVNIFLGAFNLLPAFPMDGGRVLRALLAMKMDYGRATAIAAGVGQFMAILFGVAGLFWNPILLFIALFVYLGASGEASMAQVKSILEGVPVRDAIITDFQVLAPHDTLDKAIDHLLAGSQQDFPVIHNGQFVGMLTRPRLLEALGQADRTQPVEHFMERDCPAVGLYDMLDRAMAHMRERQCSSAPVVHGGELVGLLTLENIGELMMIRSATRKRDQAPVATGDDVELGHAPAQLVPPAGHGYDAPKQQRETSPP